MTKILFMPFSIVGGFLAGKIAQLLFERVWSLVEDRESPEPEHRYVSWAKLLAALAIEGAIFRAVRGGVDHGSRELFRRLTGAWPGEEAPEST